MAVRSGSILYLDAVKDILQIDISGLGALSSAEYDMAAAVCHHVSALMLPAMLVL